MAAIRTEVPHDLEVDVARQRVDRLLNEIRQQYPDMVTDLRGEWSENVLNVSFRAYGFDIVSNVHVHERRVAVIGTIPLAALPFKGKIQRTIVDKLTELLG